MFYNALLLLGYLVYGICKRKWPGDPFGRKIPYLDSNKKPVIWIHAVSFGETKAASTLISHIQKSYPQGVIVVSTGTKTGYELSKILIPSAALHFRLPLDLSWVMAALVKKIQPNLVILVEGDYWPHFLKSCKREGAQVVVVSGKLSLKSMKGYAWAPWLLKRVDHFFVQNALYQERFHQLGYTNVTVTGNLKFDLDPILYPVDMEGEWITIGSTHEGEEEAILDALEPLLKKRPQLHILLAPRHPERFEKVRSLICDRDRVRLLDKMGWLPSCYLQSKLAIVGGSYHPKVGGHDILEPVRLGIPVLFGPYMYKQEELKRVVESGKVGEECSLDALPQKVEFYLNTSFKKEIEQLASGLSGSSLKTWKKIACDLNEY
ncbi:MAG: hypothetical protein KBC64_01240 [Simkaniaceae bacterium]|nr:hypothetical protein [Simkaniaceae bacterium]